MLIRVNTRTPNVVIRAFEYDLRTMITNTLQRSSNLHFKCEVLNRPSHDRRFLTVEMEIIHVFV